MQIDYIIIPMCVHCNDNTSKINKYINLSKNEINIFIDEWATAVISKQ